MWWLETLMGGKTNSNLHHKEKIFKGIEVKIMKKGFLIPQCGTRLRTLYIFLSSIGCQKESLLKNSVMGLQLHSFKFIRTLVLRLRIGCSQFSEKSGWTCSCNVINFVSVLVFFPKFSKVSGSKSAKNSIFSLKFFNKYRKYLKIAYVHTYD